MTTPPAAEVRAWARQNGLTVATRGRVSSDVLNAWQSAQTTARPKRRAAKPTASGPAAAPRASKRPSADKEASTSAVLAELAALTERVQRLEARQAEKLAKQRK